MIRTGDALQGAATNRVQRISWRVRKRGGRSGLYGAVVAIVALVVVVSIVYPLGRLLARALVPDGRVDTSGYTEIFGAVWFPGMLWDTATVLLTSIGLSVAIATVFAWFNERTDASLRLVGQLMPLVPLLMPPVALAIGWVFLASPNSGLINAIANDWFGLPRDSINLFTRPGLVFVYTLFCVPFSYLTISAALQNTDHSMEEASFVAGASLKRTLFKVSLPSVAPGLAGGALLTLMMAIGMFSIPLIIGTRARIDILSVRTIRSITYSFPPRLDQAVALATLILLAIGGAWFMQRLIVQRGHYATIGAKHSSRGVIKLGPFKWVARFIMILYLALASIIPLLGLAVVALQRYWSGNFSFKSLSGKNFEAIFADDSIVLALRNSILLALIGATLAIVIATALMRYSQVSRGWLGGAIDAVLKLPSVVSHLVLGMAFLLAFAGSPLNLGGTLVLLLIAYVLVNMPQSSISAGSAASQVGNEMSEASYVCGASEARTVRSIAVPLMAPGLIRGWALVFVLMAGDVSASVLLVSTNTPVVGVTLLNIYEQGTFGPLAALAVTFTVVTGVIVAIAFVATRRKVNR